MRIDEALREACRLDQWARPKTWRGTGSGVVIRSNGQIDRVPSSRGGFPWYPRLQDVVDEWEVVDPRTANQEYYASREMGGH